MSVLINIPGFRVTDSNGDLVAGAKLYAYATGTTTPVPLYLDSGLSTAATWPVLSNASGLFPDLYVSAPNSIRVKLKDADDVEIADVDPYISGGLVLAVNTYTVPAVGGTARTLLDKLGDVVSVEDFGWVVGSVNAAAANTTAMTNAMAYVAARGGGLIQIRGGNSYIAGTLDNKYPHVRIEGSSKESLHDAGTVGSLGPIWGTRLIATTANTMLKLRTPYAAEQGRPAANCFKHTGSTWKYISLDGGAIATEALHMDSVAWCEVDLFATNFASSSFFNIGAGVAGTDLGEDCGVQYCKINLRATAIHTTADKAANILRLTGSTTSNVSLNRYPWGYISVVAQHWDGRVFDGVCCDSNDISLIGYRAGGSGELLRARGDNGSSAQFCDSNKFTFVSGNGSIYAEGTSDPGITTPVANEILIDYGNNPATIEPTAGTGSVWTIQRTKQLVKYGYGYGHTAFANDPDEILAQQAAITTETQRIWNNNGIHQRLVDDVGNEWVIGIDPANGDLRIIRLAGTGGLVLGNGVQVKIAGLAPYANDAAAAAGGVPVNGLYRNGSAVQVRVV